MCHPSKTAQTSSRWRSNEFSPYRSWVSGCCETFSKFSPYRRRTVRHSETISSARATKRLMASYRFPEIARITARRSRNHIVLELVLDFRVWVGRCEGAKKEVRALV